VVDISMCMSQAGCWLWAISLGCAEPNSVVLKVGMVGDSQIGKTSLMVKYVEGSFEWVSSPFLDYSSKAMKMPAARHSGIWVNADVSIVIRYFR
jgi:GTPase SAR1 family protein